MVEIAMNNESDPGWDELEGGGEKKRSFVKANSV
jgi:hypothetical protein